MTNFPFFHCANVMYTSFVSQFVEETIHEKLKDNKLCLPVSSADYQGEIRRDDWHKNFILKK